MITLPLPLVSSLILGFLFLRLLVQGARVPWVAALLGGLALQGVVITLAQHYGMSSARLIQPVTAMVLPALAWLAWKVDGLGQQPQWRDAIHLLGPALALMLRWADSLMLEALVPLSYAGYAVALAVSVMRIGPDLPRGQLGQGGMPRLVWAGVAMALALSALSDLGIATVIALGHAAHVPLILDIATSALLFGTGLLVLGVEHVTGRSEDAGPAAPAPSEDDHVLFARLQELMQTRRPWRDPDLTLAQLARRLSVPAKRLSVAVNLVTGENISRYVNAHRIKAACDALSTGANATEAMLDAGFITKSNFNREFRRVTGEAPTDWKAARRH
ncbi:AraC family transcriptional regulator [Roseinatronobacter monicus]|uniref:AraC family transcriptional regulator n=2 Tax=Roseinatronobacter monicus TaxID=393481 RepID=A0A543K4A8_9RHOB|nr:AraC family transcriptional regulator [Roseinatronobacter monicus]